MRFAAAIAIIPDGSTAFASTSVTARSPRSIGCEALRSRVADQADGVVPGDVGEGMGVGDVCAVGPRRR